MDIDDIKKQAAKLAKDHFGLDLPFTEKELNESFKRIVKLLRPDLGHNKEEFIRVQSARDLLRSFAGLFKGIIQGEGPDRIRLPLSKTDFRDKGSKIDIRI